MKVWQLMYAIVWAAFLQILYILFSPLSDTVNEGFHVVVGLAIFLIALQVSRQVAESACPDRIKRITRTTRSLAILQGVLGVLLAAGNALSLGSQFGTFIAFLHVANALAMITQASSSATAFDMWEEKEFQTPSQPL